MGRTVMEARRDLDPASRFRPISDFDTSLRAGAVSFEGRPKRSRDVRQELTGLHDAGLRPQHPQLSQLEALLEAGLRLPEPEVARAGQGRDPDLS